MTGSDQIARLAIALDEVKPPVRRRIEVPLAIRLDRLHRVFQIVLGWEDYHLYQFRIGRDIAYGVPDPDWDFSGSGSRPANKATLADLLVKSKRRVRAGCRIVNTETLEMLQKFGIIELYATFLRFKV